MRSAENHPRIKQLWPISVHSNIRGNPFAASGQSETPRM